MLLRQSLYQSFKTKNPKHIFFITSPIVELIIYSYLEEFEICHSNVILIPLRKYKPSIIKARLHSIYLPVIEKLFYRIFLISFEGLLLKLYFRMYNRYFYLYAPWDVPQYFGLRSLKKCLGQFYLEEGQMSHDNYPSYKKSKNLFDERERLRSWRKSHTSHLNRDRTNFNGMFNDCAVAYIVLIQESFPEVSINKKVQVSLPEKVMSAYAFKTNGVKNIGIMPAPRRLAKTGWKTAIDRFVQILPDGSLLKLHPDFESNTKLKTEMENYLIIKSQGQIRLCPSNTVLEIEMAKAPKVLYGPLSSLKMYAHFFGSEFTDLKVY